MDEVADMLPKVNKLCEQARVKVVYLPAIEVSEFWEKIEKLVHRVGANDLEHQTMPGLVEEAMKLWTLEVELREADGNDGARVSIMNGLR